MIDDLTRGFSELVKAGATEDNLREIMQEYFLLRKERNDTTNFFTKTADFLRQKD